MTFRPDGVFLVLALLALSSGGGLATAASASAHAVPETVADVLALRGKGPEALPLLREALSAPTPSVRSAAVIVLAAEGGARAVADIAPLIEDDDDGVAITAVSALLEIGSDAIVEPVRKALASPLSNVRGQTAAYIGDRRDARFLHDLGKLLGDDTPSVRRTAVEALRALGRPEAFPYFMAATGDEHEEVRVSALKGLSVLRNPEALPRVVRLAGSESVAIRGEAAHALVELGGLGSHGELALKLARDKALSVVRRLAGALVARPSADALPILELLARSEDPERRRLTARPLRLCPHPRAAKLLGGLTADADEAVRCAAIVAVGRQGSADLLQQFEKSITADASARVRACAAEAVGELARPSSLGPLSVALADADFHVRLAAVDAIGKIGTGKALPLLDRVLKRKEPVLRVQATKALGGVDDAAALQRLRALARDADLQVRLTAIRELGVRRDAGAVPLLRELLREPVELVRSEARAALDAIQVGAKGRPKPSG